MSGVIDSYDDYGNYYCRLQYNVTLLQMQNKAQVYLKLTITSTTTESQEIQGINTRFCTINGIDVNFNNFTDNTIYPSYADVSITSYPFSTRFIFRGVQKVLCDFNGNSQSLLLYEGTTDVNYNPDGTLTIQIDNVDSLIDGTPTLEISVPVENASNGHVKVNGAWKNCWVWHKINGAWKRCIIWKKISGTWEKGI